MDALERTIDGARAFTLSSGDPEGIEVTFVPGAGMIGCSLRHRGAELLGQRRGLRAYIEDHKTMGIPLLYPWANRLGRDRFEVCGQEVDVGAASPPSRRDSNGLPIHGLLAAAKWRVDGSPSSAADRLEASFDFAAQEGLIDAFPFPHELLCTASVRGGTLTIVTEIHASGTVAVPVSFGYHPYLVLPGIDRAEWNVEIPVREQLELDRRLLPTGSRRPTRIEPAVLGSRTFDDAFLAPDREPFVLEGGGRRIELLLDDGYPFAQVYAPADDDVIAFEPMTAPTNALVDGGPDLPIVQPGERYRAGFTITVG